MANQTNKVWKTKLAECLLKPDYTSKPRGHEVKEVIQGHYAVPMPAYIDLANRKVDVPFMFAEAAWVLSGSNKLSDILPYMPRYADFSDDSIFLKGAYGPKVTDQFTYISEAIEKDNDTRQAVINIWRERPGDSKDIPCTLSLQFLLREGKLNLVVTMRSQDIVWGFTYDVFTFSMIAKSMQLQLKAKGIKCTLGKLYLTAGSMHVYQRHYQPGYRWIKDEEVDPRIASAVKTFATGKTHEDLILNLQGGARDYVHYL